MRTQRRLIREIAHRPPGSAARLEFVRDGRAHEVSLKLAERPGRGRPRRRRPSGRAERQRTGPGELGLTLIEIDDSNAHRFDVPSGMTGLLVQRVEPFSAAHDAGIERGQILLEINRRPVSSVAAYRRLVDAARPGGVLAFSLRSRSRPARHPYRPDGDPLKPRILVVDDEAAFATRCG